MAELARQAWGTGISVDFQNFGPSEELQGNPDDESRRTMGPKSILKNMASNQGTITALLDQYDIIIDSGAGDSFADIYGLRRLSSIIYTSRIACSLGIPVILGPQTIGPFNTWFGKFAGRYALRRATLVIARDSRSAEYASSLGRPADCLSSDVVFALPRVETSKSRDIILNVSGLLWARNSHVEYKEYRRETVELVSRLEQRGRRVSLLAHTVNKTGRHTDDDDAHALRGLAGELNGEYETLMPQSLEEARTLLASARVVFGARMHACLNAISVGVPAIAWAYSRKFSYLLGDLGWNHVVELDSGGAYSERSLIHLDQVEAQHSERSLAEVVDRAKPSLDEAARAMARVEGREHVRPGR